MKLEITVRGWRSWRPKVRRMRNYGQVQASWLWFFVTAESEKKSEV